jgi:hypothetical protein
MSNYFSTRTGMIHGVGSDYIRGDILVDLPYTEGIWTCVVMSDTGHAGGHEERPGKIWKSSFGI